MSAVETSTHGEVTRRRVLVVDDELPARRRLLAMIDAMDEYEVVGEAADGEAALALIDDCAADIVLLDIRMPGMDGLTTAKRLAELDSPPAVIFCTAYDEHALAAFEAQAVGYLLKPVARDALIAALAQIVKLNHAQLGAIDESMAAPTVDEPPEKRCVSAKTHQGYRLVPVSEIRAFVADNKYVNAYHESGELLLDQSLK